MNEAVDLLKERVELLKENEHLKLVLNQIQYCPYDDKCGELYDCSKEEYETMTQSNMKLSLENADLQQRIDKAIEYIEKYDVFKEFSFPLMKRDEENQVKSSIDYEFKTSIKKNLLEILGGKE